MSQDSPYWMNYVVNLSERAPVSGLQVGIAIVSEQGELVCSAFEGEDPGKSWHAVLRCKLQERIVGNAHSLYLTINTLSADHSLDLAGLLQDVKIENLYIGLPDPALTSYLDEDPVATGDRVFRFPDELQRKILEQNRHLYATSEQSIECNTHYFTHRIGESVVASLGAQGFAVTNSDIDANRSRPALASLIRNRFGIERAEANHAVDNALAAAFGVKYGTYNYAYDARSANKGWAEDFRSVYERSSAVPLSDIDVLNVGVGAGYEASVLFPECTRITFVDIAERGLRSLSETVPSARTLVASADNLSELDDDSYDLYVSLRTYNSSFFEASAAASEARRVLRPGATLIVSVANGFLHTERENCVVPGLIVPGTDFVDLYRGVDTARSIRAKLSANDFTDIQVTPTNTEIYLSGTAG